MGGGGGKRAAEPQLMRTAMLAGEMFSCGVSVFGVWGNIRMQARRRISGAVVGHWFYTTSLLDSIFSFPSIAGSFRGINGRRTAGFMFCGSHTQPGILYC